jgi:hypothetical protein
MSRIVENLQKLEKSRKIARHELREAADAILTRAGAGRLTKKFHPGERDPFHGRRLRRSKQMTEQTLRRKTERRERIAAQRVSESRLIKNRRNESE